VVTTSTPAQLVVVCGLPGVGKTTLARGIADTLGVTFLRIDTIEAAIVSTLAPFADNPLGYVVAGWVAADQLRAGRSVVADAVNGVAEARDGWANVARDTGVELRYIEVICSSPAEHRRPDRAARSGAARTWRADLGAGAAPCLDNVHRAATRHRQPRRPG
jgi:predicted kinase